MTLQESLSAEQWRTFADLPIEVAAAAALSDNTNDSGSTREIFAALSSMISGAKLLRHNELVQDAFEEYKRDGRGEAAILELTQNPPDGLVERSLAHARVVTSFLETTDSSGDSLEFRLWIRSIAAEIVSSSSVGGFLGIGGQVVTESEEAYIDRLSDALSLERPGAQ